MAPPLRAASQRRKLAKQQQMRCSRSLLPLCIQLGDPLAVLNEVPMVRLFFFPPQAHGDKAHLVPPYDDVNVLCGQGTVGLEMLEQVSG